MKKVLLIIGGGFLLIVILGMIGKGSSTDQKSTQSVVQQKVQPTSTPVKVISYEVLQQWDINNGGKGKIILIPADYLNEADMTTLGQKLKSDTKNDKNAFIMVFTDKKAAVLRDKVIGDTMTKDEEKFYDTHYVGQYTKNGNSGLNAFAIYYDGVSGSNNKTINY